MKKAFVTGGSGHVGANLVRQLLEKGWTVRCLVHKDTRALENLDVERVQGDIVNPGQLTPKLKGIDTVFHCAAYVAVESVDIPLMETINIKGTEAICEASISAGVERLIHFSSIHAFQQNPTCTALTEKRPLAKNDQKVAPYDRTKAEAQRRVVTACKKGINASIIHPTGIIGPHDYKPSRMGKVIIDMATGKMPIAINNGFNWVDVRDVCNTAINCVEMGRQGQHYILPGKWASFREITDVIASLLARRITYLTLPFWTAYLALPFAAIKSKLSGQRPLFSRGSLHALAVQCREIPGTLAKNELMHRPRSIEDSIKDTVQWLIEKEQIKV